MLLPGSSLYALDVASAVMLVSALLAMVDIAVRSFCFLCSGRLPRPRGSEPGPDLAPRCLRRCRARVPVLLCSINPHDHL